MRAGELADCGLPAVLVTLADRGATGCLHLTQPGGDRARVFLRTGEVYAVLADPGVELGPGVAERLVQDGDLLAEDLAEARAAQRTDLPTWGLAELLVHLEMAPREAVETQLRSRARDAVAALLAWPQARWEFTPDERTRSDVAPPVAVVDLLTGLVPFPLPAPLSEPEPEPDPAEPEPEPAPPDAAQVAAFSSELSATANSSTPLAPPPSAPPELPAADPTPAPNNDHWGRADTDTAALLRELSSLGLDDDQPSASDAVPVSGAGPTSSAAAAGAAARRRKGLFGR